ncbi:MAG TPA: dual specificity protein phosphatase family protein [Egibacteraceae bacterium]|nr:dual specificity protein phosphatase family protein [Egibacteraceae bacterium]
MVDTAAGILAMREEGKRVVVHCAAGQSRTPAVAAAYLHLRLWISGEEALGRVGAVLHHYQHNHELLDVCGRCPSSAPSGAEGLPPVPCLGRGAAIPLRDNGVWEYRPSPVGGGAMLQERIDEDQDRNAVACTNLRLGAG